MTAAASRPRALPFRISLLVAGPLSCALGSAALGNPTEAGPWNVHSPDGRLELTVTLGERAEPGCLLGGCLSYRVRRDGAPILLESPLGIRTDRGAFHQGLHCVGTRQRPIDETYTMLTGKRSNRWAGANELTLELEKASDVRLELVFRAYDDGVALRYRLLGSGPVTLREECTGFAVPHLSFGLMAPYDLTGVAFGGTYEQPFHRVISGTPALSSGWAFPALFQTAGSPHWMLLTEADLDSSYCGTRLHQAPVGSLYRIRYPGRREGNGVGQVKPRAELPLETPWRVAIIGDLGQVVESTLVDDLSRPSRVETPDWVRPGRVAWSWFTQGTGGESLQREYVDFAAEMGWEHVLIDEGWNRWHDAETVIPALARDAAAQGVGLILWYNSGGDHTFNQGTPRDRMVDPEVRRQEMEKLQGWGIAGIKVDFFWSDKQDRIQQYLGILEDAADHQLMVNFHGATLPRGWQRTYPHLMTHEAVRGTEYLEIFEEIPFGPRPRDNVFFCFTRNVVGSMDYTPVAFESGLENAGTTFAHQLALSVTFESGWQHFSDRADRAPDRGYRAVFSDFPMVRNFLSAVPATWDDTHFVEGHPATHVVLARARGRRWYVGGLNGRPRGRTLSVDLSFLDDHLYDAMVIHSGGDSRGFSVNRHRVHRSDSLEVEMLPRDGFVIAFVPRDASHAPEARD